VHGSSRFERSPAFAAHASLQYRPKAASTSHSQFARAQFCRVMGISLPSREDRRNIDANEVA
jgi:hypothetical protein